MEKLTNITCPHCDSTLKFELTDKEGVFKGICPQCDYEEWRAFNKNSNF